MAELDVGDAIDAAAAKYGLSPAVLKGIASIESSWNPTSNQNKRTQYKGLFQIGKEEWKQYGNGDIYNAKDNAEAAAKMLRDHSDWFTKNYGNEPSPGDLYMMHQQGRGFIKNGTMTNIAGNPYPGMQGEQTPQSFKQGWSDTLARRMAQYGGDNVYGGGNNVSPYKLTKVDYNPFERTATSTATTPTTTNNPSSSEKDQFFIDFLKNNIKQNQPKSQPLPVMGGPMTFA